MMYLKVFFYGLYMIFVRLKGIKYLWIKKFKGQEAADEYTQKVAYTWSKFTIKIIGINLTIEGKENIPNEPCVFIANHTSILDIPIMFYSIERIVGIIGKKEILKVPILGFWLRKGHCIPLDRENPRDAIKVINEGIDKIKSGYSMAIYPEGTRSKDGTVAEFKKGSLKLATKSEAKIVPVGITDAYLSFENERKFKPTNIKIKFGEPIDTKDMSREEQKELNVVVRNKVIELLKG